MAAYYNLEVPKAKIKSILQGIYGAAGILKADGAGNISTAALGTDVPFPILSGSSAPTSSTAGSVGQLYVDTTNKKIYRLDAVSGSTYTWNLYGGGNDTSDDISNESDVTGETVTDALNTLGSDLEDLSGTVSQQSATIDDLGNALSALGLSVVNGKLCQTYEEE